MKSETQEYGNLMPFKNEVVVIEQTSSYSHACVFTVFITVLVP